MPLSRQSSEQSTPTAASPTNGLNAEPYTTVFYTDMLKKFGTCNTAFTKLFGYSPAELVGRDCFPLFAGDDRDKRDTSRLRKAVLAATSTQLDYRGRLFAQPKTGES